MSRSSGSTRLFVDEAIIHVRGGRGGDGCVSFRREKYVPKGGPDGGDGGRGGSVVLVAERDLDTLLDLAGRHHWRAEAGKPGSGANRSGRRGEHLFVRVPVGTLVYDADSGQLLKDLVAPGQKVIVAPGGRGGWGNARFVSSTNQAPRQSYPGGAGKERTLRLELKLIADIGLVGLPNAGKSTLLSRVTRARPKIADYPFTTREPQLGILELPGYRRLVIADLPGLIEGAHEGVGLGDAFLKHIERTRVIVHLVDVQPPEGAPSPAEAYHIVRNELEKYSRALAERDEIVVASKLDLTGADEAADAFAREVGAPVLRISGVSGQGLRELGERMWQVVEQARAQETAQPTAISALDEALALDDDDLAALDDFDESDFPPHAPLPAGSSETGEAGDDDDALEDALDDAALDEALDDDDDEERDALR